MSATSSARVIAAAAHAPRRPYVPPFASDDEPFIPLVVATDHDLRLHIEASHLTNSGFDLVMFLQARVGVSSRPRCSSAPLHQGK